MLRSVKDMIGDTNEAADGVAGKVKDALFEDRYWRLRYVAVDTGTWLPKKKVLLSPLHLKELETGWVGNCLKVVLNKAQVEGSPELKEHEPISM